jgi:uncharacterized membrane protein
LETFLTEMKQYLSKEFVVMLTAALPVIELRGAIPVGICLGLSPICSAILSFIGSIIPVPFILFTIRPVFNYLKTTRMFKSMVDRITDNSMTKYSQKVKKYGFWGILILVAIPLPGTGVWTGSLVAALLDMRFKLAFPAILIGNFIAGMLIMLLSNGVVSVFRM